MKLKQQPEDFQVEELSALEPTGKGEFSLYRLTKRGWTTPDALDIIRSRWKIDRTRLSFGGLKDRHALTTQHFTILGGPARNLAQQGITVTYLGKVETPFESRHILANRFVITLRQLSDSAADIAGQTIEEIRLSGIPNYFDDQRFGSASGGGPFPARLWIGGQFEEGFRQALTAPYAYDRSRQKKEKALLLARWGDWARLSRQLRPGPAQKLADYLLSHPGDFRGAAARLSPDVRGFYLSSYQSHLWNRVLARWLELQCRSDQLVRVRLRLGPVPMHRSLEPEQLAALQSLLLPLPSARFLPDPDDPRLPLITAVLAHEGLTLPEMKIRGVRELFFSKGERAALVRPEELRASIEEDDLHAGFRKLILAFELPRGAYATLIVKRIQAAITAPCRQS